MFQIGLKQQVLKKGKFLEQYRSSLRTLINGSTFNNIIILIIIINAITTAWEATESLHYATSQWVALLRYLDIPFLIVYSVEFALKLYVYQCAVWNNKGHVFEFVVLMIMVIQVVMELGDWAQDGAGETIVDIMKGFKALRIVRALMLLDGAKVLMNALVNTVIKSAGNVLLLLALLLLFFAVIGCNSFGSDATDVKIYEDWGNLPKCLISLTTYMFAEGWVIIQERLNRKFEFSEYYAIIFITFAHFIFVNLFIGVIIMNIADATESHSEAQRREREMQLQLKKEYLYKRQHEDVHKMMEKQKNHQYDNFQEMTMEFYETLGHDDYVLMSDISCNLMWLETYIDSLQRMDVYTYRAQQCHRNVSLVLAEMAERHYKKQYGVLLPHDNPFDSDPYKNLKVDEDSSESFDIQGSRSAEPIDKEAFRRKISSGAAQLAPRRTSSLEGLYRSQVRSQSKDEGSSIHVPTIIIEGEVEDDGIQEEPEGDYDDDIQEDDEDIIEEEDEEEEEEGEGETNVEEP